MTRSTTKNDDRIKVVMPVESLPFPELVFLFDHAGAIEGERIDSLRNFNDGPAGRQSCR